MASLSELQDWLIKDLKAYTMACPELLQGGAPHPLHDKTRLAITNRCVNIKLVYVGSEVTEKGTKQVAMVVFGSRVTKVIDFEDSHKGLRHMQEKIMAVKHRREGMTSTATALNYVKEAILGQVRAFL